MMIIRIMTFLILVVIPVSALTQPAATPLGDVTVQGLLQAQVNALQAQVSQHQRAIDLLKPMPPPQPQAAPVPLTPVAAAAPTIAVVPVPQTISIPAEVRDAIVSLCGILITAAIGIALNWMRQHFAFMKEAGANAAITSSAQGLGALLEQALAKQGKSLSTVEISDPTVAVFARKLVASYPEWGPLVGLTQDIAERKVLGGAIEQSTVPIVAAPAVSPETRSQMIAATAEMLRPKPLLSPSSSPPGQPLPPTVTLPIGPGTVS